MVDRDSRTALVTGASSGLGAEFAKLLARDGHGLVLVARRQERLDDLARQLEGKYGISATAIAADLADREAPQQLAHELETRRVNVDVLVNNAGVGTYGPFADAEISGQLDLIQINIAALTHLTHLFLPGMVSRRFGRILNVASTAAFQPGPLMAVYYASKAFVLSFSEAINNELSGTSVSVTACCPGPTTTEFHDSAAMDMSRAHKLNLMMDAARVAEVGYRAMVRGKPMVIPGIGNWLLAQSVRFAPRRVVPKIVRSLEERVVTRPA